MSLSSRSSGSGSRAASPEDEQGKPRPESPASLAAMKQDRYTDLKRRSANAFTVFANEERDKLMKTHPDLPMGLVTRMMVEKWRSLDNEAKKPYFEASNTLPPKIKKTTLDAVPAIVPAKKLRIATPCTSSGLTIPTNGQVATLESVSGQPERVIIVQGRVAAPIEIPKTNNTSVISASIAQALGVTVTPHRTTSSQITRHVVPTAVRTPVTRPKPSSAPVVTAHEVTPLPMTLASSNGDAQKRSVSSGLGFTSSKEALEMFYLALCEPAFPYPNEQPLTPFPANYCYDAYLRMSSGNNGVM
ncbi:hypothetical protein KIN20_024067 [Parelaphostrongylus tenuis]|uniref:HMG box domain-containing protein n=1 Tax=Parelaphostrongylus tenuis TaxID=148309 RepID=A0AAD5MXS1_PARTN|nr:hypothetical protein KIN20_024067 [Parelaphostrongylus tenuis]